MREFEPNQVKLKLAMGFLKYGLATNTSTLERFQVFYQKHRLEQINTSLLDDAF